MANNTPVQHVCSFCKRLITFHEQYDMPILDPQSVTSSGSPGPTPTKKSVPFCVVLILSL